MGANDPRFLDRNAALVHCFVPRPAERTPHPQPHADSLHTNHRLTARRRMPGAARFTEPVRSSGATQSTSGQRHAMAPPRQTTLRAAHSHAVPAPHARSQQRHQCQPPRAGSHQLHRPHQHQPQPTENTTSTTNENSNRRSRVPHSARNRATHTTNSTRVRRR
jgi:hypothetical protein